MTASTTTATGSQPDPASADGGLDAAIPSPTSAPTTSGRTGKKPRRQVQPLTYGRKGNIEIAFLWFFVLGPFVALAVTIPLAWKYDLLSWVDVGLFVPFYLFTALGVTIGFHRYLTHGAFK